MEELWSDDRAVLIKVVELYEPTGEDLPSGEVLRQFPTDRHDDVRQSLRRLGGNDGYITTTGLARGDGEVQFLRIKGVTEGLRAAGAWPDDAEMLADRILAVLAERADNEPEPEKRSKLQAGLKGVGGMTRDVLVDVVGAALAQVGGPRLTVSLS